MLVSVIRRSIQCNLRRVALCVIYNNKTGVARRYNETNLLSTSLPHLDAYRMYSTEHDSQPRMSLPMLVEGSPVQIPSIWTGWKVFYLLFFRILPYIDNHFDMKEVLQGIKYASIMISEALANKSFESLQGLVSENMIEILSKKIETLSPNERELIKVNENDIIFFSLYDIATTTGSEHSIEVTTTVYYVPGIHGKHNLTGLGLTAYVSSMNISFLVCNYTFTRKYVDNVGGPWIATFVNHYAQSEMHVKKS